MNPMKVLIGCERSGVVRDAFRRLGHEAWSCDLEEIEPGGEFPQYHYFGDVRDFLKCPFAASWDLGIFHPPCTFLSNSSAGRLHHTPPNPGAGKLYGAARWQAMREAAKFFRSLLGAPMPRVAVENPIMHGHALAIIGEKHAQTIQPYNFGDDASKRTCLWLRNLPELKGTRYVAPRMVNGKPRWSNQTDSGQNKLTPSDRRQELRSETYTGIAQAMAEQWGAYPGDSNAVFASLVGKLLEVAE